MSRRFLHTQTELLDQCLAELAQLPNSESVNFNNTAQFDSLLRAVELSFLAPTFCQVPSVYVLHVLLTLAARCSQSNWSCVPGLGAVAGSTEYMRRVNLAYDSSLKPPISHRSASVLRRYVALAGGASPASRLLFENMSSVISHIVPPGPRRGRSPEKRARKPANSAVEGLCAVEVISDSEDSDSPIELSQYMAPVPEYRSVISLSELGAKTSGLGEVATLFKDMPHLSAHTTPEPESQSKRHKPNANLWRRIQVYDDELLAAKFSADYTFWDLVRWMYWCADSSSQYQKFLFNSHSTCVHSCYQCYASVVEIVMSFCTGQVSQTDHLLARLSQSHEQTVEITFSGLGSTFRNKPFPCYNRELILLANDTAVRVSQCKKQMNFDDNMDSMDVRVFMLSVFSHFEAHTEKRHDIRRLVQKKRAGNTVLSHTVENVGRLTLQYTKAFFGALQGMHSKPDFLRNHAELFMVNVAMAVMGEVRVYDTLEETFADDAIDMLRGDKLYRGVTEDSRIQTLEEFYDRWDKTVFLAEWVYERAVCRTPNRAGRAADAVAGRCVAEFLESRSEDADIIEDSVFTLTRAELEQAGGRAICRFAIMDEALKQPSSPERYEGGGKNDIS